MKAYSPLEVFEETFRNWWVIILLTLWGGFMGWAIHRVASPVYEARAEFTISINFKKGVLTQFEEDHAWNELASIIRSTSVMEQVVQQANVQQIPLSLDRFLPMAFVERKEYYYELYVRNTDPNTAMILANLWAEEANRQVTEAYQHALTAETLQKYQTALMGCLGSGENAATVTDQCAFTSLAELDTKVQETSAQVQNELNASRGIMPAMEFDLTQKAVLPTRPVAFGLNTLVLSGALIGFILAIWIVQIRLPLRLAHRLGHA